jgi:hypothetical protein
MLPKQLKFGSKVESSMARQYKTNVAPQNGTGPYNLGDTIILNIPTRNNLLLIPTESYLKFNVNLTSSANGSYFRWDSCGAHGLIQRIRIFSGSNLIEDSDNYGLLSKMLFDLQVATPAAYGKFNITSGTRNDVVLANTLAPTYTAVAAATVAPDNLVASVNASITSAVANVNTALGTLRNAVSSVVQINSGDIISGGVIANNGTVAATYCLNLISLIGTLCNNNYFPLFGATGAPIRVEILLVDNLNKALALNNAPSSFNVSNVEYCANFLEISDEAVGMVLNSIPEGEPLQFAFQGWRNYQYSYQLAAAQTQVNFPISAKFSSLKSIFVTCRDKGTGSNTFFPFSAVQLGILQYYFRVGSQIMPSKAPNTLPEMFCEVNKAIASMSDLGHHPSIEKASYTLQTSTGNTNEPYSTINSGSFYIGIDLETYAASQKDTIFAGYNSNTEDIFCVIDFAAQGAATTVRFDAFAQFDEVIIFENSTCYVKF